MAISSEAIDLQPRVEKGTIETNARIRCTATSGRVEDHNHFGQSHELNYAGGPASGDFCGQSGGFATTDASFNGSGTSTTYRAEIRIKNNCGGKCGPNGTNTGGEGEVKPNYKTVIQLFILTGTYNQEGRITGEYELKLTGSGANHSFNSRMNNQTDIFEVNPLNPGIYILL